MFRWGSQCFSVLFFLFVFLFPESFISQSVSLHVEAQRGHFQNSLPPSTAGDASFFRNGFGEGLSELVMEFPAVLVVFLSC